MFTVNKSSWHYKLNAFFGSEVLIEWKVKNFCQYFWMTFFKILVLLCVAAMLIAFVIVCIIEPVVLLLVLLFIGVISIVIAVTYLTSKYVVSLEKTPPGLIRTKYRSWKEKHCPMVEYK